MKRECLVTKSRQVMLDRDRSERDEMYLKR
jgi:hypothetical protein